MNLEEVENGKKQVAIWFLKISSKANFISGPNGRRTVKFKPSTSDCA